ncbi:MAG: thioredoxin family protein [Gammaproteobacteria bacterium]|nr:thioredoxin family protein [Gammaproteobacteria bacterium]MBU1654820.1 thioredoxin family protein [Gammaproteobacteria bacterium]MBU1961087.1 thioredoxin family protein [Gammaproteobacteria bacterium]
MFRFLHPLLLLPFLAVGAALAADLPFDSARFDTMNKEGRPILVTIHADWCPTCKAQEPILSELLKTPELQGITAFRVDFDGQKDAVTRFKAQYQSTLIVFKGGKEVGRSTGDTRKESIASLLKLAL